MLQPFPSPNDHIHWNQQLLHLLDPVSQLRILPHLKLLLFTYSSMLKSTTFAVAITSVQRFYSWHRPSHLPSPSPSVRRFGRNSNHPTNAVTSPRTSFLTGSLPQAGRLKQVEAGRNTDVKACPVWLGSRGMHLQALLLLLFNLRCYKFI